MTTAKVEIWKDCGFTEGTLEVPSKTSSLPSAKYTFTGLNIARDTLFSQFKVKQAYEYLYDCSYLRMTMDMNNGDDIVLYGWIDKVSCSSDVANSPMTIIDWHVDYWRTYLQFAEFNEGVVTKRPATNNDPPQQYSYMTQLSTSTIQEAVTRSTGTGEIGVYWVFCNLTVGSDRKTTTTFCWPVDILNPDQHFHLLAGTTDIGAMPSYNGTLEGSFDEELGIDPDAIYGCWISPIPPCEATYSSSSGIRYYKMSPWSYYNGTTYKAFKPFTAGLSGSQAYFYTERTTTIAGRTTDTETYVLTDMDSEPVFQFPWGLDLVESNYRIVNADTSMYIAFRFVVDGSKTNQAGVNGLTVNIPLKTIAMSTNAKSSYVYSGQQEYDRQQMNIQRNQALVSSVTSMLGSTTSNVVMSSLGNSKTQTTYGVGGSNLASSATLAKTGGLSMGAAGAITAGAGIAGASIDYLASGYFNNQIMDSTMQYKASQTSTLTLPGSGSDWMKFGRLPAICSIKWDDYSITQRQNDIDLYGVKVNEPMSSCQSLIDAGGPLRIQNLNVTGQMPVGAKQFFRERFADGVRIV